MAATLGDSLAVIQPDLPAALVPAEVHPHLDELARQLAPIHRCGFEVRLGPSSEVDFQQGILAREDEPRRLRAHLSGRGADGVAWGRVDDFLAVWGDTSSLLHGRVDELWLEFDRPPASPLSVFAGFARAAGGPADRLTLARAALDLLAGREGWEAWQDPVERCFDASPEGAYVSHIGLMIGRPAPFLRVNVRHLAPAGVGEYLRDVGWPGDPDEPAGLVQHLHPLVDGLAVCLDVGEQVSGRLGFECHLNRPPQAEPRWAAFLDELVGAGWCTAEKRDALLGWPGLMVPGEGAGSWPPDLVRASLRRPADHFTSFERRLNHIKVTYEPGRPTEAKGYFGFLHNWMRPALSPVEPAHANGARRRHGGAVTDAVGAATEFLLASRTPAGWWRDFSGTAGASEDWGETMGWSDEWVSAFVGTALARTPGARAQEAAGRAWALLVERRQPVAGWGYNRLLPIDADSTAWGLRLASVVGRVDSSPARAARGALEHHAMADGGVASYREAERPRPGSATLTPPDGSYAGWCSTSHACVTAAVAADGGEAALDFLRRAQRDDGSWAAYWWEDDEYATALAAEVLAGTGRQDDRARVESAAGWARGRIARDGGVGGSPFATAWCVTILDLAGGGAERERAAAFLINRQEMDGGWPASARLIAPRPDVTDRSASDVPPLRCLDEARTFTTATVLSALARSS